MRASILLGVTGVCSLILFAAGCGGGDDGRFTCYSCSGTETRQAGESCSPGFSPTMPACTDAARPDGFVPPGDGGGSDGGGDTDGGGTDGDVADGNVDMDGGGTDGGGTDGGGTDGGAMDAGTPDGGTDGGAMDAGTPDGGRDGGICDPITTDPSAINMMCASSCPTGYTCQPFNGIILAFSCEILCTRDCDCPTGYLCNVQTDKSGSWMECQ